MLCVVNTADHQKPTEKTVVSDECLTMNYWDATGKRFFGLYAGMEIKICLIGFEHFHFLRLINLNQT